MYVVVKLDGTQPNNKPKENPIKLSKIKDVLNLNFFLPYWAKKTLDWHYDRNLIEGTTDKVQFKKGLEEFLEVYMAVHPNTSPEDCVKHVKELLDDLYGRGRIKTDKTGETLADAIGDTVTVLINHAERNKLTLAECLRTSYMEIKDRGGRMIDGLFVKESDLQ